MNLLEMETLEKLFSPTSRKTLSSEKGRGVLTFTAAETLLAPCWPLGSQSHEIERLARHPWRHQQKSARPHRKTGLRLKAGKLYQQERLQIQLPLQSKAIPVLFSSRAQQTTKESTSKLTTCPYIVSTDSTWRIITQTLCASSYHKGFDLGGFSVEAIEHQVFHLLPPQHLRASL